MDLPALLSSYSEPASLQNKQILSERSYFGPFICHFKNMDMSALLWSYSEPASLQNKPFCQKRAILGLCFATLKIWICLLYFGAILSPQVFKISHFVRKELFWAFVLPL